jgi:DNA topoisomerase-1
VHPALVQAAKERPRDPLPGIERPRGRKWLSSAEVGLLEFLKQQSRPARKRRETGAKLAKAA